MGLNDANEPDERTLAMLVVIGGIMKDKEHANGAEYLATMYQRAIEDIRWRKTGAPQAPPDPYDR
jgi:hypothetical protein